MRKAKSTSENPELAQAKEIWETAHAQSGDEILKKLKVDSKTGLSSAEAQRRLEVHGRNELPRKPPRSIWLAVLDQFKDTLVLILLGAAAISFFIAAFGGEAEEEGIKAFIEPFVIILILVANASIGVWQEMNAEKALEALMVLQAEYTKVLRDGEMKKIPVSEVVPGDICHLEGGDKVPADIRALEAMALKVTQSALTGESKLIEKDPNKIINIPNAANQDKTNMLFSATEINLGQAKGIVVGTGMNSELGKIQALIQAAAESKRKTPLKENLEKFGELLSYIVAVICVLSWVINIPKFSDPGHGTWYKAALYYFKISVSLAVAAIPEGLPAVITTCLALATSRMASINAIIRHLSSVETLGCTTIICSDKTGTLTLNDMTVVEFNYFATPDKPVTHEVAAGKDTEIKDIKPDMFTTSELIRDCALIAGVCNDARMKVDENDKSKIVTVGTPTEAALRTFTRKMGCYDPDFKRFQTDALEWYAEKLAESTPILAKLPFTRDRKCMSVIVEKSVKGNKKRSLLIKGAAEVVLEKRCKYLKMQDNRIIELTNDIRKSLMAKIMSSTSKGLRCIALAMRENMGPYATTPVEKLKELSADIEKYGSMEQDCVFLGYVGIQDPPRKEVRPAIAKCKEAGISVVMITGDNKDTAAAIARKLNLLEENEDPSKKCLEGREFDGLKTKEAKLAKLKEGVRVFARVEPRHKSELVSLLQDNFGEVVAMTGDGVNDAPALKQADIGIAMGIAGSDVAKEASKMVLADDNFATIVNAVEEGRAIYANIKSFIRYLISSNIGEVVAIFLGSILGIPEVLTSVQLLWMNLVTDGLPAIALGFNPPEIGLMEMKPRKKDEPIIGGWSLLRYLIIGTYVGVASVAIYLHWYISMETEDQHRHVSLDMLRNWTKCPTWDKATRAHCTIHKECDIFEVGGEKATTMSLTVLVLMEMFGAMNALSDSQSLLVTPPWKNLWLCGAIFTSMALHCLIVYTPVLKDIFGVSPLSGTEWMWTMIYALPVILIEEIIKIINRNTVQKGSEKLKTEQLLTSLLIHLNLLQCINCLHSIKQPQHYFKPSSGIIITGPSSPSIFFSSGPNLFPEIIRFCPPLFRTHSPSL
eukprot:TRINITY_DN309_c0_g2_i1.p1 TRINITY_DN309_c0_g2~~TRINITY_DN309_c0_g2_i1.p1  ORF type:complete len:1105 (+),score=140.39 TRINITY_DN309_c0_g2_i1:157-3471(+)